MSPAKERMLELMFEALETTLGLIIETPNVGRASALFYELRKEQPEDFGCLALTGPPVDVAHKQLWIVRKSDAEGTL